MWVTLIPTSATNVYASISTNSANAVIDIAPSSTPSVNDGTITDGHSAYITLNRPSLNVAAFNGFNAVANEPVAAGSTTVQQVFGVSTNLNALVNVNAADGSQRQLFVNNENGVTGLVAPSTVVVTGQNGYVLVGSASNNSISVFSLDSSTGDLTFLKTYDDTVVGSNFLTGGMSYDASTGDLTLTGSAGVETITVNANGTLGTAHVLGNVSAATDSATQGNATFYVNPAANTLTGVFNNNGTVETVNVAATAGNGLTGASSVAVSPDGLYVYVASQSGGTLATFSVVTTGSGSTATHSLVNIQTLQNGDAFGTHGLDGTVALAVTPDDQYVLALNGSGDFIAVFQRQIADQPSKNIVAGDLLFGQEVHEDVSGILRTRHADLAGAGTAIHQCDDGTAAGRSVDRQRRRAHRSRRSWFLPHRSQPAIAACHAGDRIFEHEGGDAPGW